MTLRELVVAFGFEIDTASERKTEKSIRWIKNLANNLLSSVEIRYDVDDTSEKKAEKSIQKVSELAENGLDSMEVKYEVDTASKEQVEKSIKEVKVLAKESSSTIETTYGETMALVLVGNVTSAITTMENADRLTELTVVDGYVELRDTVLTISLNGKVNSKDVYQTIANEMGMSIVFAKDLTFQTIPNGFSYVRKAKNALQKIANYGGHKWTIQNQVIQITLPNRAVNTMGYLLSSETGLLGIPRRITLETGDTSQVDWEVEYLLNGAIGINDVVKLKSSMANGYFRVCKVTIDGDNFDGDWICTAQLIEIEVDTELDIKVEKVTENITNTYINKGDKVKVTRTFTENGKKKGYQYNGGTFVCWHDTYDVI